MTCAGRELLITNPSSLTSAGQSVHLLRDHGGNANQGRRLSPARQAGDWPAGHHRSALPSPATCLVVCAPRARPESSQTNFFLPFSKVSACLLRVPIGRAPRLPSSLLLAQARLAAVTAQTSPRPRRLGGRAGGRGRDVRVGAQPVGVLVRWGQGSVRGSRGTGKEERPVACQGPGERGQVGENQHERLLERLHRTGPAVVNEKGMRVGRRREVRPAPQPGTGTPARAFSEAKALRTATAQPWR